MKIALKKIPTPLTGDLVLIPVSPIGEKGKKARRTKQRSSKKGEEKLIDAVDSNAAELLRRLDGAAFRVLTSGLARQAYAPAAGRRAEVMLDPAEHRISAIRLSGVSSAGKDAPLDEWRKLGGDTYSSAKRLRAKSAVIILSHLKPTPEIVAAISEGLTLAAYQFTAFKGSEQRKKAKAEFAPSFTIMLGARPTAALQTAARLGQQIAESVCFSRDLVNTPPSDMLPATLVKHARSIARSGSGVSLKVFDKKALTRMKADALLGVSRGSSSQPYMMHLSYIPRGRARGRKTITLVGKGVTFDSGGLSIKPGKGMEDMKCDMAGAACVLGVFRAISLLPKAQRPKHEIHGLIPTCENMVSADSLKPGDVIAAMNGKTIEVLNTDAEGRLILADALSYASRIKSDLIIDLATLTGACIVALGSDYAGMFSTDTALGEKLQNAFAASGEKLWPLPLAAEYRAQMDSDVADIKNIGTGGPGAIIGALFLKEFVPSGVPWIHLDIAGPAFVTKASDYIKRGGTGFGVLPLVRFIESFE